MNPVSSKVKETPKQDKTPYSATQAKKRSKDPTAEDGSDSQK